MHGVEKHGVEKHGVEEYGVEKNRVDRSRCTPPVDSVRHGARVVEMALVAMLLGLGTSGCITGEIEGEDRGVTSFDISLVHVISLPDQPEEGPPLPPEISATEIPEEESPDEENPSTEDVWTAATDREIAIRLDFHRSEGVDDDGNGNVRETEFDVDLVRLCVERSGDVGKSYRPFAFAGGFLAKLEVDEHVPATGVTETDETYAGILVGGGLRYPIWRELAIEPSFAFGIGSAVTYEARIETHWTIADTVRLRLGARWLNLRTISGSDEIDLEWGGGYAGVELRF